MLRLNQNLMLYNVNNSNDGTEQMLFEKYDHLFCINGIFAYFCSTFEKGKESLVI